MGTASVLVERRDAVVIISLNRPERHNAVDDEVAEGLADAFRSLREMSGVRAAVLRGEGASFSSGRDTKALGGRPRGETDLEFVAVAQSRIRLISGAPCPVVAALKGWVLGGSFERALHCDLRVAAEDTKLGLPEVRYGLVPDTGGVARLWAMAGPSLTKDMVLTGRVLTAAEALAAGIVSRVCPVGEVDDEAVALATELAAQPPLAVRLARELVDELWRAEEARSEGRELLSQAACFASEDYAELKAARREGRPPNLRGR